MGGQLSPAAMTALKQAGLSIMELPTTSQEMCERIWAAFRLGMEYERQGGDKAAHCLPAPELVGSSECAVEEP